MSRISVPIRDVGYNLVVNPPMGQFPVRTTLVPGGMADLSHVATESGVYELSDNEAACGVIKLPAMDNESEDIRIAFPNPGSSSTIKIYNRIIVTGGEGNPSTKTIAVGPSGGQTVGWYSNQTLLVHFQSEGAFILNRYQRTISFGTEDDVYSQHNMYSKATPSDVTYQQNHGKIIADLGYRGKYPVRMDGRNLMGGFSDETIRNMTFEEANVNNITMTGGSLSSAYTLRFPVPNTNAESYSTWLVSRSNTSAGFFIQGHNNGTPVGDVFELIDGGIEVGQVCRVFVQPNGAFHYGTIMTKVNPTNVFDYNYFIWDS